MTKKEKNTAKKYKIIEVKNIDIYRDVFSGSYIFIFHSVNKNRNSKPIKVVWRRISQAVEDYILPIKEISDVDFNKMINDKQ